MTEVCSPYFDPEFDIFDEKIYGTRVSVDNDSCETCTVVKVNSLNKQGRLLKVVQVLTDMDLFICKCYICFDAGSEWFMDVFHVKDLRGKKVTDEVAISHIEQAIGASRDLKSSVGTDIYRKNGAIAEPPSDCTAIEMIGINRPGVFSEISAVLAEEKCNVVEAHAWSHNASLACVAYVSDESSSTGINDPYRLATIEDHLSTVLRPTIVPDSDNKGAKMHFLGCDYSMSHAEHRLHQLMLADRDFDMLPASEITAFPSANVGSHSREKKTQVSIDSCKDRGYSVVTVKCVDRPKLMFDIVCTLTDLQYMIYHASITSHGLYSYQEYYIRRKDGFPLNSANERLRVQKCLEAAIERRVCEGVRLELCAQNNTDLLPRVTRILREYGLTVAHADVAAHGEEAKNVFYVQDFSGNNVDMDMLEQVRRELELLSVQVESNVPQRSNKPEENRQDTIQRNVPWKFHSMLRSQLEHISHTFIST